MEKKLYPLKFIPIASRRPWGGTSLIKVLNKHFTETAEDGTEKAISDDELIGESWEIADMGFEDSVVGGTGWLSGNTIGEMMETYMERMVGDRVFDAYGTQFPLLVKFLDIEGKLSVQVHPDDTVGMERFDSLGKTEVWHVLDAKPGAKIYMGFKRDVSAREFYDACKSGTADKLLNAIEPKKGDTVFIKPGTVHAAEGGIMICEIQESSDLTFRLYDWGRELNPATARKMHLDEALDLIDFTKYDDSNYTKAAPESDQKKNSSILLADCPFFTVSKQTVFEGFHYKNEDSDCFIIYSCLKGEISIQLPDEKGINNEYRLKMGESILIPAECNDFVLTPIELGSVLIEATTHPEEEKDNYINPDAKAEIEGDENESAIDALEKKLKYKN